MSGFIFGGPYGPKFELFYSFTLMYPNIASANIAMHGIGVSILTFINGSIMPLPNLVPSTIILLILYVQQLFQRGSP